MSSFEELYGAHFDRLTLQLYAYIGDIAQAQDVVQEAFCRALQRWEKLAAYDDPVGWVRRVAWNLATSRLRRLRLHTAFLRAQHEQHVPAPAPDHVALTAGLAKLPAEQREAVMPRSGLPRCPAIATRRRSRSRRLGDDTPARDGPTSWSTRRGGDGWPTAP